MAAWGPIPRRALIRGLRALGFTGPFSGGKHEFMVRDDLVVTIPSPHGQDIGVGLLARVLRQAGVTRAPWERI